MLFLAIDVVDVDPVPIIIIKQVLMSVTVDSSQAANFAKIPYLVHITFPLRVQN
jgi:hypothetical protein